MKVPCEFCGRLITKGAPYDSHVHFNHLSELLARFRANPTVQIELLKLGLSPKQLTDRMQ